MVVEEGEVGEKDEAKGTVEGRRGVGNILGDRDGRGRMEGRVLGRRS